jgi:hypothetical protein
MERRYQSTNPAIGVLLILMGLAFFGVTQGAFDFNARTTWPVFPIMAGVALLALAYTGGNLWRRAGMVLGGTIPLLVGVFFLLFNTGFLPNEMRRLWPVFPLIVGVAFFSAYFASEGQQRFYLIPGSVLTLVALIFGAILWSGHSYGSIGQVWPIFLILAGVLLLLGNFRRVKE